MKGHMEGVEVGGGRAATTPAGGARLNPPKPGNMLRGWGCSRTPGLSPNMAQW